MSGSRLSGLLYLVPLLRQNPAAGIVAGSGEEPGATFNVFVLRAHWFSLEQTEDANFEPEMIVQIGRAHV